MIVCLCHRVSDRDIASAVRAGCDSFEALQDELSVATACGACHDCACETFQAHAGSPAAAPAAAVPTAAARAVPAPAGRAPSRAFGAAEAAQAA